MVSLFIGIKLEIRVYLSNQRENLLKTGKLLSQFLYLESE